MSTDVYDLAKKKVKAEDTDKLIMAQLAMHEVKPVLYPPFFEKMNDLPKLEWKKCKFTKVNRKTMPKKKGVYAFAIEIEHKFLPANCYILYVGKAGDINSKNTIWNRYYDYIRCQEKNIRPRIREMLTMWKDHLVYFHAEVDTNISTHDVEKMLTTIFVPPYNRADFTGEVADLLKGAGLL